jgi:hypothetical protein
VIKGCRQTERALKRTTAVLCRGLHELTESVASQGDRVGVGEHCPAGIEGLVGRGAADWEWLSDGSLGKMSGEHAAAVPAREGPYEPFMGMASRVREGEWTTYGDISIAVRGDTKAARGVGRAAAALRNFRHPERVLMEGGVINPRWLDRKVADPTTASSSSASRASDSPTAGLMRHNVFRGTSSSGETRRNRRRSEPHSSCRSSGNVTGLIQTGRLNHSRTGES